jgi:hypothetical protein
MIEQRVCDNNVSSILLNIHIGQFDMLSQTLSKLFGRQERGRTRLIYIYVPYVYVHIYPIVVSILVSVYLCIVICTPPFFPMFLT